MPKQYLNIHQLSAKLGNRSISSLNRDMQDDPSFPKSIMLGRRRYWDEDTVEAYMAALMEAQTAA